MSTDIKHKNYMKECIELAKSGEGHVSPNPFVGSIVLDKNGNIVGKGYHKKYGEAHAEINALNEAGDKAEDGTLYVSLEPCFHYGKTPPCIERVIKEKIKTLVVGMVDPNPLVSGKSLQKARKAGINVIEGVLSKECEKLNEIFIKNITQKKPFISIKTASTIDGKIATSTGSSKWITSAAAREEVHMLRNKYDAILTGSCTVILDNPSLTCRIEEGRNPVRIIIDSQLKTSPDSLVYHNDGTRVIIATSEIAGNKDNNYPEHVQIIKCPLNNNNKVNLEYLTQELYKERIFSILVEAGGTLNGAFLKYNLIDKSYFFIAPKILGDKTSISLFEGFDIKDINESREFVFDEIKSFPPDIMLEGYLN